MEQVKIFFGTEVGKLETNINTWLKENKDKIQITRVLQTDPGDGWKVMITIFFSEIQEMPNLGPYRTPHG